MATCGVYGIKNSKNGREYIGRSNNIERRWLLHKWLLNNGRHHSIELQTDWNEDKDSIIFEVKEKCSESDLDNKEIEWIEKTNAYSYGYNQTIGGSGAKGFVKTPEQCRKLSESLKGRVSPMKGKRFTEEHRRKISEKLMGNKNSGVGKYNHESVSVRSKTTGIVYESASAAGLAVGGSVGCCSNILNCCKGNRRIAYGQEWEYANE